MGANLDLRHPPKGTWFAKHGENTTIGATNRNLANGIGSLFFALFWNGILSIFLVVAISSTLHHLHVHLPAWFPAAPKMEGGGEMDAGMTNFLWIFLTPFILIGLFVAGFCLNSFIGHTEVTVAGPRGNVFTGIGRLGWNRSFDATQIKTIKIHQKPGGEGADTISILIETCEGKQIKLGSMLSNERRQFMLAALRKTLSPISIQINNAQRQKLGELLQWALLEIRMLASGGKLKQSADLADAFHNLPTDMWKEDFSLANFRDVSLTDYQSKYREQERVRDYVAKVNEIMELETDSSNN